MNNINCRAQAYSCRIFFAAGIALYTNHASLLAPRGYRIKNVLYLNHEIMPGEYPLKVKTKNPYRTTSVKPHANSILEYPALRATKGKLLTIPQTRRSRLETCINVVPIGALTIPEIG